MKNIRLRFWSNFPTRFFGRIKEGEDYAKTFIGYKKIPKAFRVMEGGLVGPTEHTYVVSVNLAVFTLKLIWQN